MGANEMMVQHSHISIFFSPLLMQALFIRIEQEPHHTNTLWNDYYCYGGGDVGGDVAGISNFSM